MHKNNVFRRTSLKFDFVLIFHVLYSIIDNDVCLQLFWYDNLFFSCEKRCNLRCLLRFLQLNDVSWRVISVPFMSTFYVTLIDSLRKVARKDEMILTNIKRKQPYFLSFHSTNAQYTLRSVLISKHKLYVQQRVWYVITLTLAVWILIENIA